MVKTVLAACAALALCGIARAAFLPDNFDPSVKPQDDFYRYVNGGWIKKTKFPTGYTRWGSFDELQERNEEALHLLCQRASAQDNHAAAVERMVGDFFSSGMDEATINDAGVSPLRFELDRIDAVKTPAGVLVELAHLHSLGVSAGFAFSSGADDKDSTREIAQLYQGGLGLPERDYYFRDDPKSKQLRERYVAHVARMLELLGDTPQASQAGAQAVLKLETTLAQGSLPRVALRNPYASYHKMTLEKASSIAPGIDWKLYFEQTSAPKFDTLNFAHPDFFKGFAAALAQTPVGDWRTYMRWHLVRTYAPYLNEAFFRENFAFYETTLSGAEAPKPRWQRVVATIDGCIGEALGQLYVAEYFPPEAKARALELVGNLRAALHDRIQTLEWMDGPTRAKAQAKLDAFTVKIGYPDKWRDYSTLIIDRGPYVLNVLRSNAFEVRRRLSKIGGLVDRSEWGMTPSTVNAYYRPSANEIVFPAGILQPPFFDAQADDAVNYGGIGAVIGHEMTHGYDDSGRQFDGQGNLTDWWTVDSAARFKTRAGAIVKQYNGFYVFPDLHVNGELTQGENIADLGGIRIAYAALQKALAGRPHDAIAGFTPEQRFFLSFGSLWAVLYTPDRMRLQVHTNPHSPGEFRCNGTLSNVDEFAAAFGVPEGAPMRRPAADRVTIW